MPGAISPNFHEGSRSEYLAQYVFTSWGTAVAVPHQEDHGLDLYCTLVERIGQRAWARSPYTVQVKSNMEPWVFEGAESVRWLIKHPLPLFLCVVDKGEARLRVYQTSPRFYVWAKGELPERIQLVPTTDTEGNPPSWSDGENLSLSAPILDFTVEQHLQSGFAEQAQRVISAWVEVDLANLDRIRAGIRKFVVPRRYMPNEAPDPRTTMSFSKTKNPVSDEALDAAMSPLRESLIFVSSELFKRGDIKGAALGLLFQRHVFGGLHPFMNEIDDQLAIEKDEYRHVGLERMERVIDEAISEAHSDQSGGSQQAK